MADYEPPIYTPTPADVAQLLRARTKDSHGTEVGDWTDDTRPTAEEVQGLILQAVGPVLARVGRLGATPSPAPPDPDPSASVQYIYSDTVPGARTFVPPALGELRGNGAVLSAATQLLASVNDADGGDAGVFLAGLVINDALVVTDLNDANAWVACWITAAPTLTGDYYTLPVEVTTWGLDVLNGARVSLAYDPQALRTSEPPDAGQVEGFYADLVPAAHHLCCLGTACLIEKSYYPEQINSDRSAYNAYVAEYQELMELLTGASGGGDGGGGVLPGPAGGHGTLGLPSASVAWAYTHGYSDADYWPEAENPENWRQMREPPHEPPRPQDVPVGDWPTKGYWP